MGLCTSCTSTSVATVKIVLPDGKLQEYSYPVKVSYILLRDRNVFICNSDDMEFDNVLTAVREDEELQPGELYFALPLSKLTKPLLAEEMAALAVKANAALLKSSGGDKCRCRKKSGFFGAAGGERECKLTTSSKVADFGSARNMKNGRNRRKRMLVDNLGAIQE